jgi:hypothetical protein
VSGNVIHSIGEQPRHLCPLGRSRPVLIAVHQRHRHRHIRVRRRASTNPLRLRMIARATLR